MKVTIYVSKARIKQDLGIYRLIYLGDYPQPLVVGIMGSVKSYYHHDDIKEEIPGTMDYLPAVVGA